MWNTEPTYPYLEREWDWKNVCKGERKKNRDRNEKDIAKEGGQKEEDSNENQREKKNLWGAGDGSGS